MVKTYSREEVVEKLQSLQAGRTLAEFGQELGVSASYLSNVYNGKLPPGPTVLDHIGLQAEKSVTYREIA